MSDYIAESVSEAGSEERQEPIDKAVAEHGEIDTTVAIETAKEEVTAGESTEDIVDMKFAPPEGVDDTTERPTTTDQGYMRDVAFKVTQDEVDPDPNGEQEKLAASKQRVREIDAVNEQLKSIGSIRRYVSNKNDVPKDAYVYEDDFGIYYFKALDTIRPSDVAKYADTEDWILLDDNEKVVKTIELLNELSGEPLHEADTEEKAAAWLQRHMVLPNDDPASQDVFDPKWKNAIAMVVAQAAA